MRKSSSIGESRSSSGRSGSWRRSLLLELRDLTPLRLEDMDSSMRCQSLSYASVLNTISVRSSSRPRPSDRRISVRRIRKPRSLSILPRKSKMPGMLERPRMMLEGNRNSKISRS